MPRIHATLAYGARLALKIPPIPLLTPTAEGIQPWVKRGELVLRTAVQQAILASLRILPGVEVTVTDSDARLTVDKVDP